MQSLPTCCGEGRKAWIEAEITRYRSACGCELASMFMLVATIWFLLYVAMGSSGWSVGQTVRHGAVWIFSTALVGKLMGLAYARIRLRMLRSLLDA